MRDTLESSMGLRQMGNLPVGIVRGEGGTRRRRTYEFAFAGETPVDVHGFVEDEEDVERGVDLNEKKIGRGRACRCSLSRPPSYISNCLFQPNQDPISQIASTPNQDDPYSPFLSQFNYLIYISFSLSSIEHIFRNIPNYLIYIIYHYYFLTPPSVIRVTSCCAVQTGRDGDVVQ